MYYDQLPEFKAWNNAAVHLLRGAVYYTNETLWDIILANTKELSEYFAHLGLLLILDEIDGIAYLRPMKEDEQPEGYDSLPKLFHRTRLTYSQTLLCVLFRDHLFDFETSKVEDDYCAVNEDVLFEQWKSFGFQAKDEYALNITFKRDINKLGNIGFVDKLEGDSKLWRVNSILKARIPAEKLERFHEQIKQEVERLKGRQEDSDNE